MNTMITPVSEKWLSSPLVALAAQKADLDPITTMETLLGMMNELEDACPGVPFADILAAPTGGTPEAKAAVAGLLLDRGLTQEEVDETVGYEARVDHARHLVKTGSTLTAAAAKCHLSRSTILHGDADARRALGERKRKELDALLDSGLTMQQAADEVGISLRTAQRYHAGDIPGVRALQQSKPEPKWVAVARHVAKSGSPTATALALGMKKTSRVYVLECLKKAKRLGVEL